MLTIRMQRTGRSGHAQYRVVVQDSRFSATSGRVVAYLGSYDPHTKEATLDGEKASNYLSNGAQPSDRVVKLLKAQGVKLPEWVKQPAPKERSIRNQEKLRRNRPAEEKVETPAEEPAIEVDTAPVEPVAEEVPTPAEPAAEEAAAEETPAEAPETAAEEAAPEPAEAEAEKPAEPTATDK